MLASEYQKLAAKTAIYPKHKIGVVYPGLGLVGEIGEVCNKLKKVYRDRGGVFDEASRAAILDELGDVLWYTAALATDLEFELRWNGLLPKMLPDPMVSALNLARWAGCVASWCVEVRLNDPDPRRFRYWIECYLQDIWMHAACLAAVAGSTIEVVLQGNLDKLAGRKQQGTLAGSGDKR
jgi:NTP pyrophosphatase (non-canonical NTP hydrolase)